VGYGVRRSFDGVYISNHAIVVPGEPNGCLTIASEPDRAVCDKIRSRVAAFPDPGLATITGALLAVLGSPIEGDEWRRLDPPQRRELILDGLKRLLVRESQRQPLIVLFEDLHWVDAETQAFLDRLVGTLPTLRVMLPPERNFLAWARSPAIIRWSLSRSPHRAAGAAGRETSTGAPPRLMEPSMELTTSSIKPFVSTDSAKTLRSWWNSRWMRSLRSPTSTAIRADCSRRMPIHSMCSLGTGPNTPWRKLSTVMFTEVSGVLTSWETNERSLP
jgi:hypothetical protein